MKCEKCSYEEAENMNGVYLCSICRQFAPEEKLKEYINEKIDWKILETFRKTNKKNIAGMKRKAKQGNIMSRAAFGYKIEKKELVPEPEKRLIVEEIFRAFLNENITLTSLANRYKFSINGIKKILRNFTYIGKIKFKGEILPGKHEPIISPQLFNKVQSKLESLGVS